MAIRLRRLPGFGWVALCAARSVEKPGDVYLDDAQHYALSEKYWLDYPQIGIALPPGLQARIDAENNVNREEWERTFGERRPEGETP